MEWLIGIISSISFLALVSSYIDVFAEKSKKIKESLIYLQESYIIIKTFCQNNCKFIFARSPNSNTISLSENIMSYNQKNLYFNQHISQIIDKVLCKTSPTLYDKLIKVDVDGKSYKIPAISIREFNNQEVDETIDATLSQMNDSHEVDTELIHFLTNELKRKVDNKPTYRLIHAESEKLKIGISSYFQTMSTSDVHYFNFIRELPLQNGDIDWNEYQRKGFFQIWNQRINEILNHNFTNYSASIGCAVLTIIKQKDGTYLFFAKENSTEKNGGLDGHVSPSFMYQPSSENVAFEKQEMSLSNQIIREFGEELLNMKELQPLYNKKLQHILNEYRNGKKSEKLRQLNTLLHTPESGVKLYITGLVLDVFRLRPEITCLLLIENEEFLSNLKIRGNWEAKGKKITLYELTEYKNFLERDSSVPDLCAPGMAALINGMEYANNHIFNTQGTSA